MNAANRPAYPTDALTMPGKGMTLFEFYVAHAPAEPWPEFTPHVLAQPPAPPAASHGSWGFTDRDAATADAWRADPHYDLSAGHPHFKAFEVRWLEYWDQKHAWDMAVALARRVQWPLWWSERVCAALDDRAGEPVVTRAT